MFTKRILADGGQIGSVHHIHFDTSLLFHLVQWAKYWSSLRNNHNSIWVIELVVPAPLRYVSVNISRYFIIHNTWISSVFCNFSMSYKYCIVQEMYRINDTKIIAIAPRLDGIENAQLAQRQSHHNVQCSFFSYLISYCSMLSQDWFFIG